MKHEVTIRRLITYSYEVDTASVGEAFIEARKLHEEDVASNNFSKVTKEDTTRIEAVEK